jgi:hypothetical protein
VKRWFFTKLMTMKKLIITSIFAVLVAFGTTVMAQDYPEEYLGLPGDNLNLYAVLKLFQESETLESFERSLNDENSRINNLDLNGDNMVDYITVNDYVDGYVHNIVLRTVLDRNEYQDVAVFTVQKFRDGSVQIQLVGDEALYGGNYIIEPYYEETPNPGYMGKNTTVNVTVVRTTPYQVAAWPVIRFIYLPRYVVWRSSWYWGFYPRYWRPWRPFYWHYYYGYHYNWYHYYYRHYRHWPHYRYTHFNNFYFTSIRVHSPKVVVNINEGKYKSTYARPEQRRDGEALYTKMYSSQNRRTPEDDAMARQVNQDRRSASQATQKRTATGTSTGSSRRPAADASNRTETKSSSGQNAATTRRSSVNTTERAVSQPTQTQKAENSEKPKSSTSSRTVTRPSQTTKSDASKRATPSASGRSSSKSEGTTRASSSRSSRSSAAGASRSKTQSKSSSSKKAGSSSKRSSSKKEKDDNKSTRRR